MEEEYSNLLSIEIKNKIEKFVQYHLEKKNNLVLITSGGTTVPLEQHTVRFIDNFSIGTRGSASAEYFLNKNNYCVIFMYRKRTLKPFERKLNNINMLDLLKHETNSMYKVDETKLKFNFELLLNDYNRCIDQNLLLNLEYTSLFDYFSLLEFTCKTINCLKSNALIYLAAAVSDFYIPKCEMAEHKIQSNCGNLTLDLKPVPKLISKLKSEWCPDAFLCTFKLETNPCLLQQKCLNSLQKYKHQIVIGNILETRKNYVVIYESNGSVREINLINPNQEIEQLIVDYLVELHTSFKLKLKE